MNLRSDCERTDGAERAGHASGIEAMAPFAAPAAGIAPFEFRMLSREGADGFDMDPERGGGRKAQASVGRVNGSAAREVPAQGAIEAAMREGLEKGEREGRRAMRAEMEAETRLAMERERRRLQDAVKGFRGAQERYFADVEQEVVRLALAIAARVLHREAQMDPLLLAGAVRVALEKMADRSGVVLRVAGADVEAWEQAFRSMEEPERPHVTADASLGRGECVLDTKMGTVQLGVGVQLEEIEKGFFDLLQHRPVE